MGPVTHWEYFMDHLGAKTQTIYAPQPVFCSSLQGCLEEFCEGLVFDVGSLPVLVPVAWNHLEVFF